MKFTIEQQVNALIKHANRNGYTMAQITIRNGYKSEYCSAEGQCVFLDIIEGGYITLASIVSYRQDAGCNESTWDLSRN